MSAKRKSTDCALHVFPNHNWTCHVSHGSIVVSITVGIFCGSARKTVTPVLTNQSSGKWWIKDLRLISGLGFPYKAAEVKYWEWTLRFCYKSLYCLTTEARNEPHPLKNFSYQFIDRGFSLSVVKLSAKTIGLVRTNFCRPVECSFT